MALFYVAFYELDVAKLRGELVSLYTVDCVRRVATESVIPFALTQWALWQKARKQGARKKDDDSSSSSSSSISISAVDELEQDEYEQFDDFLEMAIQLGYVLLFASAFPLAAPLSLACNFIEIRSDAFKLAFTVRRPRVLRARDIGPWQTIITIIVWASAVTNVVVAGLTSEQLKTVLPSLFEEDRSLASSGTHAATVGGVVLMVGIEHALLLVGALITICVPSVPEWVTIDERRRAYEHAKS